LPKRRIQFKKGLAVSAKVLDKDQMSMRLFQSITVSKWDCMQLTCQPRGRSRN